MRQGSGMYINAFSKSLRKYKTMLYPAWAECMFVYGELRIGYIPRIISSRSYSFVAKSRGMDTRQSLNFVMQSFFDQEEPTFNQIIHLNCSTRTTCGVTSMGELDMETLICRRLERPKIEGTAAVVDFRELCSQELGHDIVQDVLREDFKKSSTVIAIVSFLENNDLSFPCDEFVTVPSRAFPQPDLIMDSKYYPARNDLRAYCKDRNLLRHLSGCCLHRLILPADKSTRQALHREQVLPSAEKDLLRMRIPIVPGHSSLLGLSDISNFTGSAANAWCMLLSMSLWLSAEGFGDRKAPNVFAVKENLFKATWKDILAIYLYLTVGVPCYVGESQSYEYLPGGFLGVSGNITIGLLFLSLVLENIKRYWKGHAHVQCQAGGDDCAIGVVAEPNTAMEVLDFAKYQLSSYVGHIKEWIIVDLSTVHDGDVIRGGRFCKKRIRVRVFPGYYEICGEPSIPIPEALVSNEKIRKVKDQLEMWRNFDLDLDRYVSKMPQHIRIADTLRAYYLHLYPSCQPPRRVVSVKTLKPHVRMAYNDGYWVTLAAQRIIESYNTVYVDGRSYLNDPRSRIRLALSQGLLRIYEIETELHVKRIVAVETEKVFIKQEEVIFTGLEVDRQLLNKLVLS